jgi:hypothetical protein
MHHVAYTFATLDDLLDRYADPARGYHLDLLPRP